MEAPVSPAAKLSDTGVSPLNFQPLSPCYLPATKTTNKHQHKPIPQEKENPREGLFSLGF
jgi:hypothetical protein